MKTINKMVPGQYDLEGIEKEFENEFPNATLIEGKCEIYTGWSKITLENGDVIENSYWHHGFGDAQKHTFKLNNQLIKTITDPIEMEQLWKQCDYDYPKIIKKVIGI